MTSIKNKNPFSVFLHTQKYFIKHIFNEHPKSFIFFFVLSMLSAFFPAIIILLNKNLINTITGLGTNTSSIKLALFLLLLNLILQYGESLIGIIENYIFSRITQTVNFVLKKMMLTQLITIPLEEYDNNNFFDTINLANTAISGNGVKVIGSLVAILKSLISLISILGILLAIHWTMPIGLFISTLPGIILIFIAKSKRYKMSVSTSSAQRELNFTDSLFTQNSSIKELKLFDLGAHLIDKWSFLFKKIQKENLDLELWETKTQAFAVFILQLSSFGVSVLLVFQIANANLTIGDYVALLGAVATVQMLFSTIGGNLGSIFETAIFNKALMEILDYDNQSNSLMEYEKDHNISEINDIELENVSFSYPSTKQKAIDNISLKIKKGESISIVGYNGSGKTTLIKCLLGLYSVSEGKVNINGINLKRISEKSYYRHLSAIFQDFYKYKFSVRDNIGFGDLSKLQDDDELFSMLEKVNLNEKVNSYEHLLDTYLTKEISGGEDLSGGEWQKIGIARGFIKNADLIILDEPTAAMDPISELQVFKIFNQLSQNKTSITISHRLGPTKYADRIIVMDKGMIVEEGNFEDLLSRKGLYYEMYMSQISWYKDEKVSMR